MPKTKSRKTNKKKVKNSFFWVRIGFLVILGLIILFIPGQNIYTMSFGSLISSSSQPNIPEPKANPYPENFTGNLPGEDVSAESIVIRDENSGVYLYKKNENLLLAPASTTKILTAMVALDKYKLDDVLTVKTVVNNGQSMGLVSGEKMTVENLLYGSLIHSANDAAYVLAENYPGGIDTFIKDMNQKAVTLNMTSSNFTNPQGYDNPAHKVTAIDLSRLASVALANKTIAKMVAIPSITISDINFTYYHSLTNVNQLLGKIPGVGGIKTGWTEEAGENLVTMVERDGHRVILVVLHSEDRFGDTTKLIDWVFSNFKWENYNME
ncbi:D-alanyl-D-alanine carboxypeptidase family protein [Patescibacteria group bacterium]